MCFEAGCRARLVVVSLLLLDEIIGVWAFFVIAQLQGGHHRACQYVAATALCECCALLCVQGPEQRAAAVSAAAAAPQLRPSCCTRRPLEQSSKQTGVQ